MNLDTRTHLYIIGNGFDLYHGAESGYKSFRKSCDKKLPIHKRSEASCRS